MGKRWRKYVSKDAVKDMQGEFPDITAYEVALQNPPHLVGRRMNNDQFLTSFAELRERVERG